MLQSARSVSSAIAAQTNMLLHVTLCLSIAHPLCLTRKATSSSVLLTSTPTHLFDEVVVNKAVSEFVVNKAVSGDVICL